MVAWSLRTNKTHQQLKAHAASNAMQPEKPPAILAPFSQQTHTSTCTWYKPRVVAPKMAQCDQLFLFVGLCHPCEANLLLAVGIFTRFLWVLLGPQVFFCLFVLLLLAYPVPHITHTQTHIDLPLCHRSCKSTVTEHPETPGWWLSAWPAWLGATLLDLDSV